VVQAESLLSVELGKLGEKKEHVNPPLDQEQIDYVMRLIEEEVHPVANTPLGVAFPWCCCCIKNWPGKGASEKPEGSHGEALLDHKKGDSDIERDPILTYGFGINAYLNTMLQLAMLFLVFTILTIPTFLLYTRESAYTYGANQIPGDE
jgi:hypothetical protein